MIKKNDSIESDIVVFSVSFVHVYSWIEGLFILLLPDAFEKWWKMEHTRRIITDP